MEPFPAPRHTIKGDRTFYTDVKRWLGIAGHAYLRQHEGTSADDLALHLEQLCFDQGEPYIAQKSSRYRIGFYDVEGLAQSAAEWAVETYVPSYRRRFTAADAAKGGKRSKRPSKLLDRYKALPVDISITEAAQILECHERTISKLRVALVEQQEAADKAILDQLDFEAEKSLSSWQQEVDARWSAMGLTRDSHGVLRYHDPEPVTVDRVLEGIEL